MAGAHILGDPKTQPRMGLKKEYFIERDCFLDCRGYDMLDIHPRANISWEVRLITQSHNVDPGMFGQVVNRPIYIGPDAWICSFATLYNCWIGEGAVVALGAVVRSMRVEPWTMVEGNPARVIKKYDHALKKWIKV